MEICDSSLGRVFENLGSFEGTQLFRRLRYKSLKSQAQIVDLLINQSFSLSLLVFAVVVGLIIIALLHLALLFEIFHVFLSVLDLHLHEFILAIWVKKKPHKLFIELNHA